MKYGKEFQHILEASDFPDDWKHSAIEYGKLKKLIKNVVSELEGMGLSPDVLHKILDAPDTTGSEPNKSGRSSGSITSPAEAQVEDDEVFEFEFESPELATHQAESRKRSPKEVVLDPVLDDGDDHSQAAPGSSHPGSLETESAFGSSLNHPSNPQHPHHHKFRLRLLSDEVQDTNPGPSQNSLAGSGSPSSHWDQMRHSPSPSPRPASVMDMIRTHSEGVGMAPPHRTQSPAVSDGPGVGRWVVKRAVTDSTGVKAEYVLAGDERHPVPQIRLHVSHFETTSSHSPSVTSDASSVLSFDSEDEFGTTDSGDVDEEEAVPGSVIDGLAEITSPRVSPMSPTLAHMRAVASPIFALASGADLASGMGSLSLGEAAAPDSEPRTPRMPAGAGGVGGLPGATGAAGVVRASQGVPDTGDVATPKLTSKPVAPAEILTPKASALSRDMPVPPMAMAPLPPPAALDSVLAPTPSPSSSVIELSTPGAAAAAAAAANSSPSEERDFIIPLQSDQAFFEVLTAALTSLSEFHRAQQEAFRNSVAELCKLISSSIQPGDGVKVLPTPPNTSSLDHELVVTEYRAPSSVNQKDLYVWREIFALWIESEIFESSAERDRGERTVDEAERRLKAFAAQVIKRGLGDRRTIKGKRTRKAWEEFLRLNVLLLDLKRFQLANIDAARKILKKHDKRTALTASTGLQAFVRDTLSAHVRPDGSVSTWTFYNTSLPHVLLASLTDTLLPILPSLDDYSCLICMSIAFKPIRLACGHLFCVRCLVKMQERGKDSCPLCRSHSVLLADKSCLDIQLMNFMKDWFPREVKEKQRENSNEIAKETMEAAGLDARCVVM